MNRSKFWMMKYMNGSVFSKARYMNGVGFEILTRRPVPKLPLSSHPPRLYMLTAQGQGQITNTPGDNLLITTKKFYYFDHTM